MKFDAIVTQGKVFTGRGSYVADIGIIGEKIAVIAENLRDAKAEKRISARGKYVIPGGIDMHVHLQLPFCGTVSADDFVSGTRAAAAGGVTTIIDYAMQDPKKGLGAAIEKRRAEADGRVCVDYSLHCSITRFNDATRCEMQQAVREGIPTFKMFMIYEAEGWQSDDAALFAALEATREMNARIMVHAESERVMNYLIKKYRGKRGIGAYGHVLSRPNFVEEEAVARAVKWAEATCGKLYVVHMSTGGAAEIVRKAQRRGVRVLAETCPQYLLLQDDVFEDKRTGHLYATCPQVKKREDNERLWKGLHDGEVAIVSTDTCTFTKKQKAMWRGDFTKIPYGMPGVETLLPSMYTFGVLGRRFDMNRFVELISVNPARIMGLYPRKGTIAPGSDADLCIFDPKKKRRIDYKRMETNCDWSPFQGWEMAGFPEYTLLRGKVIYDRGSFVGKSGDGQFLKRRIAEDQA